MALSDQDLTPLSDEEMGPPNTCRVLFCPRCKARYSHIYSRCIGSACQQWNGFFSEFEGIELYWLSLSNAPTYEFIIWPMIIEYEIEQLALKCVNKEIAFPAFLDSSRDLRATLKTPSL